MPPNLRSELWRHNGHIASFENSIALATFQPRLQRRRHITNVEREFVACIDKVVVRLALLVAAKVLAVGRREVLENESTVWYGTFRKLRREKSIPAEATDT